MRRLLLAGFVFAFALGCGGSAAPTTPATPTSQPHATKLAVLLMAHGGPPEWNEGVLASVKPLRDRWDIEVAFGMADAASLQEGVRKLEARGAHRIGVVRLFVSGESWAERTEQILGIRPGAPPPGTHAPDAHAAHGGHSMEFFRLETKAQFAMSREGLADAPSMGNILADRAAALSKMPPREDVLVLAHGPGDDDETARWIAKLDDRAKVIRARLPFRRVQVETLREDWPEKRVDAEKRIRAFVERAGAEGGVAIVIPFRVQGFGPYKKVLEGLTYAADGTGLIPHAEVTKWIERQIGMLEPGAFQSPPAR